ncbi:uncharacterized protein [Periplaneta americana]|uniref:uncharacterized protein isoform X2 n=1 Tax=Periplaneta americana TaxID=6978 RepID=UPI0037E7974E
MLIRYRVVMDAIKTEPEVDPLGVQLCDDTIKEEENPLPDEANLPHLKVTVTKTKCVDHSCDLNSEIKVEDTPLPGSFPVVKCEVDEDLFDLDGVQQEQKVELSSEEAEVLTKRRQGVTRKLHPVYRLGLVVLLKMRSHDHKMNQASKEAMSS